MNRDRYGELVDEHQAHDEHQAAITNQGHHCDQGWLDRDADNPVPCLRCRPHLVPQPRPAKPDPARIIAGIDRCRSALAAHQATKSGHTPDPTHPTAPDQQPRGEARGHPTRPHSAQERLNHSTTATSRATRSQERSAPRNQPRRRGR